MRLIVPLTGTAVQAADGTWRGHPDDSVRIPDKLNLGNVSWQSVSIDWAAGTMVIEVTPSLEKSEDTGQVDAQGKKVYRQVATTPTEQQALLDNAKAIVASKTPAEHLAASGNAPLKKVKAN